MKRSIALTCLIVFITQIHCYSQKFRIGIRGGLNLSTFAGNDAKNLNLKPGFHLGSYAQYQISDRIGIQPEVLVSYKGYLSKGEKMGVGFTTSQRLTYLDIPIMAKVSLYEEFGIVVGIQPSILLSGKYKQDYRKNIFGFEDVKADNKTSFSKSDIGIVIGAQHQINHLNLGLRFIYGVSNVFKDSSIKGHNLNLMATVGYSIGR